MHKKNMTTTLSNSGSKVFDLGIKMGSPEEVFLTSELEAVKEAVKKYKENIKMMTKAIEDAKFLSDIYKKRIKEIEYET